MLLANPPEDVEVGGEERESNCLLEVTRSKGQYNGENESKPEVGGSEEKIVIAAVGEEVRRSSLKSRALRTMTKLQTSQEISHYR